MKISEVLHFAADECLSEDGIVRLKPNGFHTDRFSCCAVEQAIDTLCRPTMDKYTLEANIFKGLQNMGCDTGSASLFKEYGDTIMGNPDVQGMRYFWLKWAALMAEEQGQ